MSFSIPFLSTANKGKNWMLALGATALMLVMLTLVQDYLRSKLQQTGYYFSESFLFSSFWWLFAPLWYAQYRLIHLNAKPQSVLKKGGVLTWIGMATLPVGLHLLLFPTIVWVVSAISFNHTFRFGGTLQYTLSEHLYLLLAFYGLPVMYEWFFRLKKENVPVQDESKIIQLVEGRPICYPETLWVDAGSGSKIPVSVSSLTFCTANTPYINLYAEGKKYLYSCSLKALETKLDPQRFVRIHKTTLVNVSTVVSIRSRRNGDYDVALKGGEVLRVSRHYAAHFKAGLEAISLRLE